MGPLKHFLQQIGHMQLPLETHESLMLPSVIPAVILLFPLLDSLSCSLSCVRAHLLELSKYVIVCVFVCIHMLVVMTCVFPNVTKALPGIWIKYCADVAAWRDELTGGNHSRVPVCDMKRSSKNMLVLNIIPATVNPRSHQGSCCKACS